MQRCAISSIFGWCAVNHDIMINGPAITEENRAMIMSKLTTLEEAVPWALTGTSVTERGK
jgi:hypothetical protein